MVENVRFDKREMENDRIFAKELADLGDLYVNDAFNAAYNNHSSLVGITEFLPSYAGPLLAQEVAMMERITQEPDRPLVVVIGGAKIGTKMEVVSRFLREADHVLLGGALANTILHMQGMAVGKSVIDLEAISVTRHLDITSTKLHMPVDAVISKDATGRSACWIAPIGKLGEDDMILDIGPDTIKLFDAIIRRAKMVVWNGPLGKIESPAFSQGTVGLVDSIGRSGAFSVIGGGDSITFLAQHNLTDKLDYISTGGGTMLKYLSGEKLLAIEKLR